MKESRSSNFELLRIILILSVIALHYNSPYRHGAFSYIESAPFINQFFLYSVEALALCAVNTFLCISGYFLSKRESVNVRKVVFLFTVLIAYKVISYIIGAVTSGSFSIADFLYCFSPVNYYAWLYCAIYLLSPFLNLVFKYASDKSLKIFMAILLVLFSILPTITDYCIPAFAHTKISISAISIYGNGNGYTLVNFILLYYVGGFIAHKKINLKWLPSALGLIFCTAAICAMMFIEPILAISYCNIFVVLQAALLFLLFKNLNFKSRFINFIAKSVWGIFIIHSTLITLFIKEYPLAPNISGSISSLLTHFSICIAGTFLCALVWDKLCSLAIRPIQHLLDKVPVLNKEISLKK